MLANTATLARPALGAHTPPVRDAAQSVSERPSSSTPMRRADWRRGHRSFRGTRIFTGLMLGWSGLVLFAFAAFAVPAAHALGRASVDAGLMELLGGLAPSLAVVGALHVVAAFGIGRDRRWGFRLGIWMLALGTLVVLAGFVFAVAGRDPFAVADPASPSAANGLALLTWLLGLYALAGWGMGRIATARGSL